MNRRAVHERVYSCLQEIGVLLDDGDRGIMRDEGLTPTHFNLLRQLGTRSNADGCTITQLAELTLCTRGNVTRLVQRLVEAGLVTVRSDSADQRLVRVELSELGADRLAAAKRAHAKLNAARLGGFHDDDISELLSRLEALADGLRRHLARP
jgi:DNA-binding MarR family transcriptional regulator